MMPHIRLASAITLAITNGVAKRLAKRSPSVAINIGTQEIQPILPLGFISRSVPREVVE